MFEPCQFFNTLGEHPLSRRLSFRLLGNLGIRTHLRRMFKPYKIGRASQFTEGQWVQVLDKESIARTLDAQSRLRGLVFVPYQWSYCEGIYRVQKVVQCIIDDEGVFRPVSRTVLLENVVCSPTEGCGRNCPLLFRDDWLKPASAPAVQASLPPGPNTGDYMRVRSAQEIRASLDRQGKRDGLMFMPEMFRWTGMRFRVARRIPLVWEFGTYLPPKPPVYILDGLNCSGAALGQRGPCDRGCSIRWHGDWLLPDDLEAA